MNSYEDVDAKRAEESQLRLQRLLEAEILDPDPDNPPADQSNNVSDWGSELQLEAIAYGLPEPQYLTLLGQPGFIRKGFVHLLSAAPKAGKTELLLQSIADWDHQNELVYYFTEEYRDLWLERLHLMHQRQLTYEHVRFFYMPRVATDERPGFIRAQVASLLPTVVVVDTIRSGLVIEDESNNPAIRAALEPLTRAAHAHDTTLILVHHTSKALARSSRIESAAGGLDFLGAVDGVINLSPWPRTAQTDTRRKLTGAGRMKFGGEMNYWWPDKNGPLEVMLTRASVPDALGEIYWVATKDAGLPLDQLKELERAGLVECSEDLRHSVQGKALKWRRLPPDPDNPDED